jgi:hypothetical protein
MAISFAWVACTLLLPSAAPDELAVEKYLPTAKAADGQVPFKAYGKHRTRVCLGSSCEQYPDKTTTTGNPLHIAQTKIRTP